MRVVIKEPFEINEPFDMVSKPAHENLETPSPPVTLRTRGEPELPKVKQLNTFSSIRYLLIKN
jgi:hypothetical protein